MNPAICAAIRRKNLPRLIELLDEAGDDVNLDAHKFEGNTALYCACECDFPEGVELLLSRGATPDVQCHRMVTLCRHASRAPLHLVSQNKSKPISLKMAQSLIRFGASVDVVDSEGNTPLKYAVMESNLNLVDFLLRQGADPLKEDKFIIHKATEKYDNEDSGAIFRLIWRFIEGKKIAFPVSELGEDTLLHIAAREQWFMRLFDQDVSTRWTTRSSIHSFACTTHLLAMYCLRAPLRSFVC